MGRKESDNGIAGGVVPDEEYFKNAREWYSAVYHYPIASRSLYAVIAAFSVATLLVSLIVATSILPIEREKSLIIFTEDVFGELSDVRKLLRPGSDLNVSIATYLIPIYVKTREYYEYDMKTLEESFALIRNQSSREVFSEYQHIMNPRNKSSPLTRYGKNIKRQVKIGKYSVDMSKRPYTARVEFSTSINDGRRVHKNKYVADITFRFSLIKVDQLTGEVFKIDANSGDRADLGGKIDFVVTKYEVKELVKSN